MLSLNIKLPVLLVFLFLSCNCSAQLHTGDGKPFLGNKHWYYLRDSLPSFVDVKLLCRKIRSIVIIRSDPQEERDYWINDSLCNFYEKKAQPLPSDTTFFYKTCFGNIFIKLMLKNNSQIDTLKYSISEKLFKLEFFKLYKGKYTRVPLRYNELDSYRSIDPNTIDTSLMTIVQPSSFTLNSEIGLYKVRCRYRQTYGKQIKIKYTNDVYFRIIE